MIKKRTLEGFFVPQSKKKQHLSDDNQCSADLEANEMQRAIDYETEPPSDLPPDSHPTYPFPVPQLPTHILDALNSSVPEAEGRVINDQPDLDLLYFQPFIPKRIERNLFEFLREKLFFYRVSYQIKRGTVEATINTPRFTTVFGVDTSCVFDPSNGQLVSSATRIAVPASRYPTCAPRPLPTCLDELRRLTEVFTGTTYNFCLVNYYASGNDSISYHSDDERFLGPNPAIASFSLGAKRDFLMKHKPSASSSAADKPLKLPLGSGDMVLMRGSTQANWLHSIPKRTAKGGEAETGRINITFRKALIQAGTANYYKYNVGDGPVYRWSKDSGPGGGEMVICKENETRAQSNVRSC